MSVNFLHISDLHICDDFSRNTVSELITLGAKNPNDSFLDVIGLINGSDDLDFVLISGDLTHEGDLESCLLFKSLFDKINIPAYFSMGNHDNRENMRTAFSFDGGDSPFYCEQTVKDTPFHLITLDSASSGGFSGIIDDVQLNWLKATIKGLNGAPTLLMLHHPPFAGSDIDSLFFQLKNSEELLNIIKSSSIKAIFCGHTHKNYTYMFGGIPCFTADSTAFGMSFTITHTTTNNVCGINYVSYNGETFCARHAPLKSPSDISIVRTYDELYGV